MSTYINKTRRSRHAVEVRSLAAEKAERYAGYRRPFEDWARQTGQSEEVIQQGLDSLQNLIDHWTLKAEQGELGDGDMGI